MNMYRNPLNYSIATLLRKLDCKKTAKIARESSLYKEWEKSDPRDLFFRQFLDVPYYTRQFLHRTFKKGRGHIKRIARMSGKKLLEMVKVRENDSAFFNDRRYNLDSKFRFRGYG